LNGFLEKGKGIVEEFLEMKEEKRGHAVQHSQKKFFLLSFVHVGWGIRRVRRRRRRREIRR
jgi:hypothetical protein